MATTTTKLDAVNQVLRASSKRPVTSLSASLTPDASIALGTLESVSRDVQSEGWHFNTEYNVPLVPDSGGLITLPSNVGDVDIEACNIPHTSGDYHPDPIYRDGKVYDLANQTYVWPTGTAIKVTLVRLLDFTELPEVVRQYVAARAAREHQENFQADRSARRGTETKEAEKRAALLRAEARSQDANDLETQPHAVRRPRSSWRFWRA